MYLLIQALPISPHGSPGQLCRITCRNQWFSVAPTKNLHDPSLRKGLGQGYTDKLNFPVVRKIHLVDLVDLVQLTGMIGDLCQASAESGV